nr:serine hydrolase [uncultured Roseococcus sp.]
MPITIRRRRAFLATPLLLPAGALAQGVPVNATEEAMTAFAALPGTVSAALAVDDPSGAWQLGHHPDRPLFVGSVLKTFILAAYLLKVQDAGLTLAEPLAVNDEVRSLVSPVLGELTGRMPARSVLEAMIAHSDNTATDIALKKIGVEAVREAIARVPLNGVRLAASTRRMFSYLAGAAPGQDLGWAGMEAVNADRLPGPARGIMGEGETMVAPASTMVAWYRHVLSGRFFTSETALSEFRRISAMADALNIIVPPGIAAYGKGGSIVWNGENALSVAGQMVVRGVPASFCFSYNWPGGPESVAPATEAMIPAVRAVLRAVATRIG